MSTISLLIRIVFQFFVTPQMDCSNVEHEQRRGCYDEGRGPIKEENYLQQAVKQSFNTIR